MTIHAHGKQWKHGDEVTFEAESKGKKIILEGMITSFGLKGIIHVAHVWVAMSDISGAFPVPLFHLGQKGTQPPSEEE